MALSTFEPDTLLTCDEPEPERSRDCMHFLEPILWRAAGTPSHYPNLPRGKLVMHTPNSRKRNRRSTNLSLRISETTKEQIERRAVLRTRQQQRRIKPGQVARELLEYALTITD